MIYFKRNLSKVEFFAALTIKMMEKIVILLFATIFAGQVIAQGTTNENLGTSTGNVTIDPYCSFPDQNRFSCHIDSKDSGSFVRWTLRSGDGSVRSLGSCSGLRMNCRKAPDSGLQSISRWFSWSSVSFPEGTDLSGSTISCEGSHLGQSITRSCNLEDPTAPLNHCVYGKTACDTRGWSAGSINGVAVCCPPRQDNVGLSINMNYRQAPCLCPK